MKIFKCNKPLNKPCYFKSEEDCITTKECSYKSVNSLLLETKLKKTFQEYGVGATISQEELVYEVLSLLLEE